MVGFPPPPAVPVPRRDAACSVRIRHVAPLVCLALAFACTNPSQPSAFDRLSRCTPGEGPSDARCGTLQVFEDREAGSGREIGLKVVLLPALANDPAPDPVFYLSGGPGSGAASMVDRIEPMFDLIRRSRDVVLVDQRGTGESGPLECDLGEGNPEFDFTASVSPEQVQACLDSYGDADPRQYVTPIAMDDLDDVRAWLGYDRINLYGGSYGTRAALVYLRRHEEHVRTVVLDGVAPVQMTLPLFFARDAHAALEKVFRDCETSELCNSRFPSLRQDANALFARLEREPVDTAFLHPRTGERLERTINRDAVAMVLTGMLYSPWLSTLAPLALDRATQGDFQMLMPLATANEAVAEIMSQGMFYSVVCSEDWPKITPEARERESRDTFVGEALFESRWKPCEYWPQAELPARYYEPVRSDKPVLIFSGGLDPVTPPSWGELAAETLPNARHIIAAEVGHGVSPLGCAPRLIDEFLESANATELDAGCIQNLRRPAFLVTPVATVNAPEAE